MRTALILGAVAMIVADGVPLLAQSTGRAKYIVIANQVEVRSGPTTQFYPTSLVRRGDTVTVVRSSSQPGWLEIEPPSGSFSWINARFVKRIDAKSGHVASKVPVPVMPGSAVTNRRPDVEKFKVQNGTVVAILDKPLETERGNFLPIQPAPNEVRFIPATSVRLMTNEEVARLKKPSAPNVSTLAKADQALRDGRKKEAMEYYKKAAEQTQDFNVKSYCYQKLASLTSSVPPAGNPHSGGVRQPGNNTWQPAHKVARQTPPVNSKVGYQPNKSSKARWSPWGILRRTAVPNQNGQPVYVLEDQQGRPLMYVTTRSGLSLNGYVGQTIALYGSLIYPTDGYLRTQIMVGTHVARP